MRLRNIPGAREAIAESDFTVNEPANYKGCWKDLFENDHPIRIEIGMGKGQFIMELARRNPEINYIGIEKYSSVLLRGLEKQREEQLPNLIFLRFDAEYICDIFAPGEIDRIYLNFSDPWPKDRHAKRRLTSTEYLARYHQILKGDGIIEFKTDNADLFAFSVESAKEANWNLDLVTDDLHNSPYCEGNIMTEYEARFSAMGNPIHKMIIHREFH